MLKGSDHAKQGLEAFISPVTSEEIAHLRIQLENISKLGEKYMSRRQVILRELKEIAAEVLEKGALKDGEVVIVDVRESLVKADEIMELVEAASTEHLQLLTEKLKVFPPQLKASNSRNAISRMNIKGRNSMKLSYNSLTEFPGIHVLNRFFC
jgi:phosphoribosylanthranilate isomerase